MDGKHDANARFGKFGNNTMLGGKDIDCLSADGRMENLNCGDSNDKLINGDERDDDIDSGIGSNIGFLQLAGQHRHYEGLGMACSCCA